MGKRMRVPATNDGKLLAVLLPKGKRLATATKSELRKAARMCAAWARRLTRLAETKRVSRKVVAQPAARASRDPFSSDAERKQAVRDRGTWLGGRQRRWLGR